MTGAGSTVKGRQGLIRGRLTLLFTPGLLPTGPFKNVPFTDTHIALISKGKFLQATEFEMEFEME